jgi:hypothetical protein
MKKGGSLSFLVGTISNVLVKEIGWTQPKLSYDRGFVYRRTDRETDGQTDGHGETSITPSNFVAGHIISDIRGRIYSNMQGVYLSELCSQ